VRVLETVAKTVRRRASIHLIGHSSGGLDIRLLAAGGVSLPTELDVEHFAARIRSVARGAVLLEQALALVRVDGSSSSRRGFLGCGLRNGQRAER